MSAATGTRIFGMRVTIDPKIIVGVLVVLAGFLFWYNSGSDEAPSAPVSSASNPAALPVAPPSATARPVIVPRRAGGPSNERGTLRLRAIDASRGDVDPTLRLDLLKRLSTIQPTPATRSLFEVGAIAPTNPALAKITGPKIPVKPATILPPQGPAPGSLPLQVNIPFKYYGFVKPATSNPTNQGFFLDGDNVLVASEGEVVKQRYLVVELTPNSARLEDTQLKQGQTLPVVPVAMQ